MSRRPAARAWARRVATAWRLAGDLGHDPLRALPDRADLLARVAGAPAGVLLFVDLDRFKTVNDGFGHTAGDEVLVAVARRISAALPPEGTLARLSSDEYVVFLPGWSVINAVEWAAAMLVELRQPLAFSSGEVFPKASVGVADVAIAGSAEDALRHADSAMRGAKASGGNSVAVYDESMHERASQRLHLESALHRALDRGELLLHHQPIVELDGGEVVGFEALLRWQQADGTLVPPAEFIPIAEATGTIVPIGAWVLGEALGHLRGWIASGSCLPSATMSVNVSARQLADSGFAACVGEALAQAGVAAESLWLEITETAMIADPDAALACVRALHALGVRIALDDFGTGFSSLSLLQRFPLQRLKIDRAFVAGVADTPSDTALVRTIVAMAGSLDLDLVAEGVETVEQLRALTDLGCGKAQGFLLGRPQPPEEIPAAVAGLRRAGVR